MKPFAILLSALSAAALLSGLLTGWDLYPIACIATIGTVAALNQYFRSFGPHVEVRKATLLYAVAAIIITKGVALNGVYAAHDAAQRRFVSVFYNGTCETLQVVKPVPGAVLVFDGSSYAYLPQGDITGISTEPGCHGHPQNKPA